MQALLEFPQLVKVGYFHMNLSIQVVWGSMGRHDSLVDVFEDKFEDANLVDIEPVRMQPTWCNGR